MLIMDKKNSALLDILIEGITDKNYHKNMKNTSGKITPVHVTLIEKKLYSVSFKNDYEKTTMFFLREKIGFYYPTFKMLTDRKKIKETKSSCIVLDGKFRIIDVETQNQLVEFGKFFLSTIREMISI